MFPTKLRSRDKVFLTRYIGRLSHASLSGFHAVHTEIVGGGPDTFSRLPSLIPATGATSAELTGSQNHPLDRTSYPKLSKQLKPQSEQYRAQGGY